MVDQIPDTGQIGSDISRDRYNGVGYTRYDSYAEWVRHRAQQVHAEILNSLSTKRVNESIVLSPKGNSVGLGVGAADEIAAIVSGQAGAADICHANTTPGSKVSIQAVDSTPVVDSPDDITLVGHNEFLSEQRARQEPTESTGASRCEQQEQGKAKPDSKASAKKPWYHNEDDEPPPEYKFGGLCGMKKELSATCYPQKMDGRTFEKKFRYGSLWARKFKEGLYEVWFKGEPVYEAAKKRLEELRRSRSKPSPDKSG